MNLLHLATLALVAALVAALDTAGTARAAPLGTEPVLHDETELIGLWGARTVLPHEPGELKVVRRGATWRATLGDAAVTVRSLGTVVRLQFPGNVGGFRGELDKKGSRLRGFWLQPARTADGASGLSGADQAFASPLVLRKSAHGDWRGAVHPLADTLTHFVDIHRAQDGQLVGEVRNPEFDFTGGSGRYRVHRAGDDAVFTTTAQESAAREVFRMHLLHAPDRLRFVLSEHRMTADLERLGAAEARTFFPRPEGSPVYRYERPLALHDGWRTARARDVGMNEGMLEQLVRRLIAVDPTSARPALIDSVLVAHDGKLVLEEYFHGFDRDTPHDMRSAAKTFASVLMGTAQWRGVAIAPEDSPYRLMAGLAPFANPDPRKSLVTLGQLMTHTSGLDCDDNREDSPGAEDTLQSQTTQRDWLKYTLDLPLVHEPGQRYAYCSAGINLVGGALSAATGSWLPELFDADIARPLGFAPYYWPLAADGAGYIGGGAFIRPRDLLKLGQTYLDRGVWRGHRIVAADWVARSTAPHVTIDPSTTGLGKQAFDNAYVPGEDGYAWHLGIYHVGGRKYLNYAATGNGGQLLIVVPDFNLTVVFTASNYGQGGIWNRFRSEIVPREIIPAIRSGAHRIRDEMSRGIADDMAGRLPVVPGLPPAATDEKKPLGRAAFPAGA
jgi:CubicO group peptidase (beta-lactamase class C family)